MNEAARGLILEGRDDPPLLTSLHHVVSVQVRVDARSAHFASCPPEKRLPSIIFFRRSFVYAYVFFNETPMVLVPRDRDFTLPSPLPHILSPL